MESVGDKIFRGIGEADHRANLDRLDLYLDVSFLSDQGVKQERLLGPDPILVGGRTLDAFTGLDNTLRGRNTTLHVPDLMIGGQRHFGRTGLRHAQQDFQGFGAHSTADELRPVVGSRIGLGVEIIDLGDVPAGTLQKDHLGVLTVIALDDFLGVVDPVRADTVGVRGGVAGEVDDAAG